MKYLKLLIPLFVIIFISAGAFFWHFEHKATSYMAKHRAIVLGVATTSTTSEMIEQVSSKFQSLQDENARLQTVIDRQEVIASMPRDLKRGMAGSDVTILQRYLNKLTPTGSDLTVSGRFTKQTEAEVKKFQKGNGLKPSGIVDFITKQKLAEFMVEPAQANDTNITIDLQELVDAQQAQDQITFDSTQVTTGTSTTSSASTSPETVPVQQSDTLAVVPDCVPADISPPADQPTPLPSSSSAPSSSPGSTPASIQTPTSTVPSNKTPTSTPITIPKVPTSTSLPNPPTGGGGLKSLPIKPTSTKSSTVPTVLPKPSLPVPPPAPATSTTSPTPSH